MSDWITTCEKCGAGHTAPNPHSKSGHGKACVCKGSLTIGGSGGGGPSELIDRLCETAKCNTIAELERIVQAKDAEIARLREAVKVMREGLESVRLDSGQAMDFGSEETAIQECYNRSKKSLSVADEILGGK